MNITAVKTQWNEVVFWKLYFHSLNATAGRAVMTDKYIEVAAFLMTNPRGLRILNSRLFRENVKEDNLSYSELMRVKVELLKIGIIKESVNKYDKRKKDHVFADAILVTKEKIKNQDFSQLELKFVLHEKE